MSHNSQNENTGPMIRFSSVPYILGSWTILRLPPDVSARLPSRGMTLVSGLINDKPFRTVLEPDGRGSHWFRIDEVLDQSVPLIPGEPVDLAVTPSTDWPEPEVPADLAKALSAAPQASSLWREITPMARWDWIRWIKSTKRLETRSKRIMAACDKLSGGERRPCCFNRSLCAETKVSHRGILLDPPVPRS